ncbi:hypothetical protein [Staphylococcus coagulans]|uniref:hypothetical protein n=1 Tax=Staphylococcus coagulans TaxID=74706 RepID=UPI0015F90853|nr:hypothetical protein [Staphylococcus coagulans]MBA8763012.1 hypothetical protein [Staphylococcus coagulans]MBT2810681.1 hypothetical protein [Staphylococcus coagulans]MBT2812964.1 hypothetical protein [Staphylococcus coagulans]MBT2819950.1 hypothetical protein [Staphylococcus coagulans]MBT2822115.1 hypothetical protein [Staphylococcus coagulans]
MNSKVIILKDDAYEKSNVSITFTLKNIRMDEGLIIYYFEVMTQFENQQIETELAIFNDEIQHLKGLEFTPPITKLYFLEPDISLTVIEVEKDEFCVYVNLDSGVRMHNIATESGISVRLNVAQSSFKQFINEIASIESHTSYLNG